MVSAAFLFLNTLVYPKYGLQLDVNSPEFRISCLVMACGYMVQPCWFIRRLRG